MAKVLYVTANPKPAAYSYSLSVGDEFINAYRALHPQDEVVTVDVYSADVQEIDGDVLNAWGKFASGAELSAVELGKVQKMGVTLDQFLEADKVVFVTPMWNFGFPPRFKAYVDSLCIAGKTFKYSETGPVGLIEGKKVLHIHGSGGIYSTGPAAAINYTDPQLKAVMGFIGITDYTSVLVEGTAIDPNEAQSIKEKAIANAREVAGSF